jgi:group I intron endonuclease
MTAQSGIYCLYNATEQLIYIGSSSDIANRFIEHRSALNGREHVCKRLQQVWNRHGRKGFEFLILETCCNHELLRFEQLTLIAASQIPGLTVANSNKSYSKSCGKISGKPVQSRVINLIMKLNYQDINPPVYA